MKKIVPDEYDRKFGLVAVVFGILGAFFIVWVPVSVWFMRFCIVMLLGNILVMVLKKFWGVPDWTSEVQNV